MLEVIEKLGKFIVDTLRKGRANFLGVFSRALEKWLRKANRRTLYNSSTGDLIFQTVSDI